MDYADELRRDVEMHLYYANAYLQSRDWEMVQTNIDLGIQCLLPIENYLTRREFDFYLNAYNTVQANLNNSRPVRR